tara:strand:+ start:326 stop:517 length:192 start_codon:yes stop_codon:yes gene_type:complete
MHRYRIQYTMDDMPEGYVGSCTKYAKDSNQALKYILKKKKDKNGFCVFKRGSTGRILSVEELH